MSCDETTGDTYISFTTYEARVKKIGPMLSSLLDQWPADRVVLTVAHDLELPAFVEDSGINTVRSADYGPFKKHSPLYMNLGIRKYIVVDDDCTFPNGWFDNLLRWSNKLPGQVVCGKGRIWRPERTLHYLNSKAINAGYTNRPVSCHIYIGLAAALFRTDFFKPDVFPYPETWLDYSDDIWFSAKLKDEVRIYVVPYCKDQYHEESRGPRRLSYGKGNNSRWKKSRANGFADKNMALCKHRSKILKRTGCLV